MIWRLIYNDNSVIDFFETNDKTITPYKIFNGEREEDCFKKIDELELVFYYPLNDDEILLFSGGNRTIIQKNELI
jgi:hypothetical protein